MLSYEMGDQFDFTFFDPFDCFKQFFTLVAPRKRVVPSFLYSEGSAEQILGGLMGAIPTDLLENDHLVGPSKSQNPFDGIDIILEDQYGIPFLVTIAET